MELSGVLFIVFFFTTIYLSIKLKALQDDNKWLEKERNTLRTDYLEILNKFYDTTYNEEKGYMVIETKLRNAY
jgi:preprotein translocase subunit SecG